MYIDSIKNIGVDKRAMEQLLTFWIKQGVPLPEVFESGVLGFDKPILFRARHVASGKNEDYRFVEFAHEHGMIPVWNEYLQDDFVSVSKPKLNLLYPRNLSNQRVKLTNPNQWEKRKISSIKKKDGQCLIEFHHELCDAIPQEKYYYDLSQWLQKFGRAKDYYFADFTLFTALGVLAGDFHGEANPLSSKGSGDFTKDIVEPAYQEVKEVFGVAPKIFQFSYEIGDELYRNI